MRIPSQSVRLRIYTGENNRYHGRPLFEAIVEEARSRGLAGATVIRGLSGYGPNSRVRSSRILVLSEDLPVVIELVDEAEKIEAFLPFLNEAVKEGLITRQPVEVVFYNHNPKHDA
ncbi:MAG: uncharacterized protein PWQ57_1229 [Desulfovibrionales bacterium]|jgi:PII-like signaling protein|nr:uncharacterized protein [Desulfovibrionales bacterium]